MGILFKVLLTGKVYSCRECGTHITASQELISTSFTGRTGPAMLFARVVNVVESQIEDRTMTTGLHSVMDIYCNDCGTNLGWRYEEAYSENQRYKRGKYLLEKALLSVNETDVNPLPS